MKKPLDYKQAGVNIEAGNEAVRLIKADVESTYRSEVISTLGGFAGMFALDVGKYKEPILVSGTDGVGTKLKVAIEMGRHNTVGIDLVAMCVNDILVTGAEPLFFLDYLAIENLEPAKVKEIVSGIVEGCKQAGCSLLGGETAEMPGFYHKDEYDLAGFAVGVVERSRIIDGSSIQAGDLVIGIPSSGLHSNGFSLARKILEKYHIPFNRFNEDLGKTWGEALLEPTKIYVKEVLPLLDKYPVKGMAHITGGGLLENLNRCLPKNMDIELKLSAWSVPSIFTLLQELGNVYTAEMYRTFNMGIGYCLIVSQETANELFAHENLQETLKAAIIGKVIPGRGEIVCQGL
ncbi:phosphoribosylformylglycinamidine cyclo-ligase [Desulfitibacter alkalitolerans]|uniref:phosphoribosylformylglycinamidine cyclo-ligase n=1 Tax=Desulfitibacter alkalitolerans TaxID=264641 RepID=UPI000486D070|nr:phosphoribosylformylglycinamidine cyclo-ligase [Desulfitibacter alkalitolerans]